MICTRPSGEKKKKEKKERVKTDKENLLGEWYKWFLNLCSNCIYCVRVKVVSSLLTDKI